MEKAGKLSEEKGDFLASLVCVWAPSRVERKRKKKIVKEFQTCELTKRKRSGHSSSQSVFPINYWREEKILLT